MSALPPYLKQSPHGCVISLKVQARSSQSRVIGPEGNFLKIKLKSSPVEGKANEEILAIFKKMFKVPRQKIDIIQGERSRTKLLEIQGLTPAEVWRVLHKERC